MKDLKKLALWTESRYLFLLAYQLSESFPHNEADSLTRQIQNSCAEILALMLHGFSEIKANEPYRFLQLAKRYVNNLEKQLAKAYKNNYLNDSDFVHLIKGTREIMRMLTSFILKLKADEKIPIKGEKE